MKILKLKNAITKSRFEITGEIIKELEDTLIETMKSEEQKKR